MGRAGRRKEKKTGWLTFKAPFKFKGPHAFLQCIEVHACKVDRGKQRKHIHAVPSFKQQIPVAGTLRSALTEAKWIGLKKVHF